VRIRLLHEYLHSLHGAVGHALAHDVDALGRSCEASAVDAVVNSFSHLLTLSHLRSVDTSRHLCAKIVEVEVVEDGPVVGDGSGTLDMIEKAENRLKAILK